MMKTITAVFRLYDDPSTREKLTVMTKWDAVIDDERNTELGTFSEEVEAQIQPGHQYRILIERMDLPQMTTIARIARLLLAPARAARNALYAAIDAWRDTLAMLPIGRAINLEPLSPEEYRAISEMLDSLDSGDTIELTPDEFAEMHAGVMLDSEHDFADYD